jgi:hypothetical protein
MEFRTVIKSNSLELALMFTYRDQACGIHFIDSSSFYLLYYKEARFPFYERYYAVMTISPNDGVTFPMPKRKPLVNFYGAFIDHALTC